MKRIEELGFGKPAGLHREGARLAVRRSDPKPGRPTGFEVTVRELTVNAGAGFVVALTGAIFRMPGLPRKPMALNIELQPDGEITGLE